MKVKKWFLMEEASHSPQYYIGSALRNFVQGPNFFPSQTICEGVSEYRKGTCFMYFPDQEFKEAGKKVLEKVFSDKEWAIESNERIRENGAALREFANRIRSTDFSSCSNQELAALYSEFNETLVQAQASGMPSFVMEYHELFTKYLADYLQKRISEKNLGLNASEVLAELATPLEETAVKQSEVAMLELAARASQYTAFAEAAKEAVAGSEAKVLENFPEIECELNELHEKFSWISYVYEGPAKQREAFAQELVWLAAAGNAAELLEEMRKKKSALAERQALLEKELGADEFHKFLFEYAREIVFCKGFRKDSIYYAFYCAENLLKEIAARLRMSLEQLRAFQDSEIIGFLRGKPVPEAEARWIHSAIHFKRSGHTALVGEEAKDFVEGLGARTEIVSGVSELRGTCACIGKAVGKVRVVFTQHDMHKVEAGDVLVSPATNPDLVPAMKKASAVVTDQGGLTSHAAIVSRELGVPCIVGVKNASKILKDGDLVEVDASKGIVRKL